MQTLQLVSQAALTVSIHYGLGDHVYNLTQEQVTKSIKYAFILTTPGVWGSIVARISITIFLLQLFGTKTWFRRYLYIITPLQTVIQGLAATLVWGQCKPVQAIWDHSIQERKCWSSTAQTILGHIASCE